MRTDPSVAELMRQRVMQVRDRRPFDKRYRLGLAVEGGGARGVFSAGMLVALERRGLRPVFDGVYGNSAGALNAAFFVAGRAEAAINLYLATMIGPPLFDRRRLLHGRAVLDLDYLFHDVLDSTNGLDLNEVLRYEGSFGVDVTFVDVIRPVVTTTFDSANDLRNALRASAWRPLEAGGATTFRGQRVVDGAILRPMPLNAAIADRCTHILSLSTKSPQRPPGSLSPLQRVVAVRLEFLRRGLGRAYTRAARARIHEQYQLSGPRSPSSRNAHQVWDLAPPPGRAVPNWESDGTRLKTAAAQGRAVIEAALGDIDGSRAE